MRDSCEPYRGYAIEVNVSTSHAISLSGMPRRYYNVSWSVYSVGDVGGPVASVPERVDFISYDGAFNYGEKRAREFIVSKLACESA